MEITPQELRRKMHRIPELMFQEFQTTEMILEALAQFPILKIHRPLPTGFIAEYKVNDGDYLLFRADIDALPIIEATGVEYSSTNNNMHACGHDVHSSILYGFISEVMKSQPYQNIFFLFQPGEEGGGGAKLILDSGVFDNYKIRSAFALHVTDEYEKKVIASTKGVLFASAYELGIEIFGKSAHVAFPENGIHSFDILCELIAKIKEQIKLETDRIIFGYGKVTSGTARNIIPYYTAAECTIRALDCDSALKFREKIELILSGMQKNIPFKFNLIEGSFYTEVKVDEKLFDKYAAVLSKDCIFIDCGYKMTGEDFGFIAKKYPSFMFWLGTANGEKHGLHNDKFLPDEDVIGEGIKIFTKILNEEMKID